MTTHRQIALAIQRGRRFLAALKLYIESGPVTQDQFRAIAKEHKLDKTIPEGFIVSGVLTVFELPEPAVEPNEIILMEPGKQYLAYWKKEPDDEMAYAVVIITQLNMKFDAFTRFMESCKLPAVSLCIRCSVMFPSRLGKKYCSAKCRTLDHAQKKTTAQASSLKERAIRFLTNVRSFLQSL